MAGRVAVRGASREWLGGLGRATDGGVDSGQVSREQFINMTMIELMDI